MGTDFIDETGRHIPVDLDEGNRGFLSKVLSFTGIRE